MKTYIPKQPKNARERVEAKLEARLVRQLERYCEYLESDRDYVLTKVLELIFRKDKGFVQWLAGKGATATPSVTAPPETPTSLRRVRVGGTD